MLTASCPATGAETGTGDAAEALAALQGPANAAAAAAAAQAALAAAAGGAAEQASPAAPAPAGGRVPGMGRGSSLYRGVSKARRQRPDRAALTARWLTCAAHAQPWMYTWCCMSRCVFCPSARDLRLNYGYMSCPRHASMLHARTSTFARLVLGRRARRPHGGMQVPRHTG